jgi:ParB family chromosome partitioning protein
MAFGETMTTAEKITLAEAANNEEGTPGKIPLDKSSADKRRALGRGLDSLLPGRPRVVAPLGPTVVPSQAENASSGQQPILPEAQATRTPGGDEVTQIRLDQIDENPYQTRQQFDEGALEELTQSIRATGLIQPIVVRSGANGRFILVIGERRCRASKLAGKETIPAIVRTVSEQQAAEMTIVENLLRRDLNCLEQANAFARLSRDFGLTQDQIGQRTGVSRESVSNYMRILRLPESVQRHLADGRLGFSEARVLLQLSDPGQVETIAEDAARKQYTVTFLQELVDNVNRPTESHSREQTSIPAGDPNVRAAQAELERALGLRVKITDRNGKGRIVIDYATLEDFDRVVEMLSGKS